MSGQPGLWLRTHNGAWLLMDVEGCMISDFYDDWKHDNAASLGLASSLGGDEHNLISIKTISAQWVHETRIMN